MTTPLKWYPADYMDEIMPDPRASAEAWVIEHAGSFALAAADDENQPMPIVDGETVEFVTCQEFGTSILHFTKSGPTLEAPWPEGAAQCVIMGDPETMGYGLDETVKFLIENDYDEDEYLIAFYTYSNIIRLRFDAATRSFFPSNDTH